MRSENGLIVAGISQFISLALLDLVSHVNQVVEGQSFTNY